MNPAEISKLKINTDATEDKMMAIDVANPLRILSAYLTTTATIRPPTAWQMIAAQAHTVYP